MNKVSGADVIQSMIDNKITEVDHHPCAVCGYMTKYLRKGVDLFYDSGCNCSSSINISPVSWISVANWINEQPEDRHKIELASRFGIVLTEPVEDATVYGTPLSLTPLAEFNSIALATYKDQVANGPVPNGIACPECGEQLYDTHPGDIVIGLPPQIDINCSSCSYKGYRYQAVTRIKKVPTPKYLSYIEWYAINEDSINLELAESEADRELDFDTELEFEERYQRYLGD